MSSNLKNTEILITKASGETEPFSESKLRHSLEKVKASSDTIQNIIQHIRHELRPGMTTSHIYHHAFSLLRKKDRPIACRYSLKRAIHNLGPSGHPFEKLIGKLLVSQGFTVEVGKIVKGFCVNHEIDVIAEKDNLKIIVECKFHNQSGIKSDIKVSLYVEARFQDIEKEWKRDPIHLKKKHEAWLITNTKLTTDAIQYAKCVGMKTIGWSYPKNESLEILIDKSGLHPITCLTTLNNYQKNQLLEKDIVLCKELLDQKKLLQQFNLSNQKMHDLIDEINKLSNLNNL